MLSAVVVNDFTGGLNYRADAFQLADNESPDLQNIDIDPRGGFSSRGGMTDFGGGVVNAFTDGNFKPKKLFSWDGLYKQLLISANDRVYWTDGQTMSASIVNTDNQYGASFTQWSVGGSSSVYIACGGGNRGARWNGSAATLLTASGGTGGSTEWQNSYASPTGTHMPKANLCATHIDRLWVADTYEGSTLYPNRIRWSHPSVAESWRQEDYIDVVGGGSGITALVSFGDQLLIFKKRAVFALLGYDEETFQLVPLTTEIGAINAQAIAASEQGVFFFSWPDGLFVYNGQGFTDLFPVLRPLIQSGEITEYSLDGIFVSWVDRKVAVSFPLGDDPISLETYEGEIIVLGDEIGYDSPEVKYGGAQRALQPTATFVWDSTIGENGAWTKYVTGDGYGLACATNFIQSNGRRVPVALHPYQPVILRINQEEVYKDTINGVQYPFLSYYTTKWQDGDNINAKKFWRRPEMVVRQLGEDTTINVDVYHNWNRTAADRSYQITLEGKEIQGGYESWGRPDLGSDLVKGYNLGLCNSVQLKISASGIPWGINAITYKFNLRRVRL